MTLMTIECIAVTAMNVVFSIFVPTGAVYAGFILVNKEK